MMVACNLSLDTNATCAVCNQPGKTEDFVFRFHNNGEASYYFCERCQEVPIIPLWLEKGNILEWLEQEKLQVRLI